MEVVLERCDTGVEADVMANPQSTIAMAVLHQYIENSTSLGIQVSLLLDAKADDELPEELLASFALDKIDVKLARKVKGVVERITRSATGK